jgi:hypothetical protein
VFEAAVGTEWITDHGNSKTVIKLIDEDLCGLAMGGNKKVRKQISCLSLGIAIALHHDVEEDNVFSALKAQVQNLQDNP